MSESPFSLKVDNLSGGYNGITVFHGASFSAHSGDIVVVLGPNGSGKTTLLRTMLGLIPALSGVSRMLDVDMHKAPVRRRAEICSWVPQLFEPAWSYSVYDIVAQGRFVHAGPLRQFGKADERAIQEALRAMDIAELIDKPINELSGGQARRVLVARALAQETPLIALDEPAAHLDPGRQMELLDVLKDLARLQKTVIISLHDVNLAYRLATRAVLITPEGPVLSGSPEEVLTHDNLEKAYETEFLHGNLDIFGKFSLPISRTKGTQQ